MSIRPTRSLHTWAYRALRFTATAKSCRCSSLGSLEQFRCWHPHAQRTADFRLDEIVLRYRAAGRGAGFW
jgi:hypothetical protein